MAEAKRHQTNVYIGKTIKGGAMIKNKYTQATLKKYGIESDYYRLRSPLEINDLSALLKFCLKHISLFQAMQL